MRILKNCNERLESKAHGAQRHRHINEIGEALCNAAIEARSKFWEDLK